MSRVSARALFVSAADGSHELRPVDDPRVVGPIDFAWSLGDAGRAHTTFGVGPIAGSVVPGSNRLVVTGWSPIWDTFYPSTIGGAGLPWDGLGVAFMAVSGRAPAPSVLRVTNLGGQLAVRVEPIDVEAAWRGDGDEEGLHALMARVLRRHGDGLEHARVLAVGPAAARTRAGAIGSAPIRGGELTRVDTWAGRGGLGSRLWAAHRLVAIIYGYGGDAAPAPPADRRAIDDLFRAEFGRPMKLVDLEQTTKYRFNPAWKTGGTFGANFHLLRERAISFNYRSVLMDDDARGRIHERLIAGHYLRQFNEEIVAQDKSFNCGEPCGALCKKVDGKYKKDYEPYQSMGPLVGVFDQRAAERLNRFADACGFDAIQIGGEVAWVMECLDRGLLGAAETGIAERPRWEPDALEPVADSAHNAAVARRVIEWILRDPRGELLRQGLRAAARAAGGEAGQLAVYNASGDGHGCLVPNQYWVPGVFAPVPIMGRYYLDYDYEWKPPRELGRSCAERMVKELMLDNYGMCRFHRGWAERLLPDIVGRVLGRAADPVAHHRRLAGALAADNRARPWETDRVVALIHGYLAKYRQDGPPEPELDRWLARFARDPRAAARAYWQEMRDGFEEGPLTTAGT